MASQFNLTFLLVILFFVTPSTSLTCSSQKLTTNFTNCTDLPSLKSLLHWTFDPTKSTLSVAFTAAPATPNGWIAWGLNPTSTLMPGTQALLASKSPNGSVIFKTYDIISYRSIKESKLSYKLLESKAESSNGTMTIFAMLELPKNTTTVNQVWQVGPAVKDGFPVMHGSDTENLNSKGTLDLVASSTVTKSDAPAPSSSSSGSQSGNEKGGSSAALKISVNVGFTLLLFVVASLLLQL